ncbi:MAG: hypothetical protein J0I06_03935 [Planctomycetes bacterium]|nr:hypothetical protein [Planctomycetota bacterium]
MLEIIILITLCKNIAAKARDKGRSGGGFGFLLVVLWLGGEIFGAIVGAALSVARNGGGEPDMLLTYGGALAGAIVGALVAFGIVSAIAPVRPSGRYDDHDDRDDYDDRPRRRDQDDYDDRPRRRDRDDRW